MLQSQQLLYQLRDFGKYLIVPLFAFGVAAALSALMIRIANTFQYFDKVTERKIHSGKISRLGGIALFMGVHLTALLVFSLQAVFPFEGILTLKMWEGLILGSSILFLICFYDDLVDCRWWLKLTAQIAAALVTFLYDMRLGSLLGFELPVLLDLLFTVTWYLLFINSFNLIDGLDGLAAGLAICSSVGLIVSAFVGGVPVDLMLSLALMGACGGFLMYNVHPAKIFMGDAGSNFLGFTLSALALISASRASFLLSFLIPLLVVGLPAFELMVTVMRRTIGTLWRGEGWLRAAMATVRADRGHLHHKLVDAGLSQSSVAKILYTINLGVVGFCLFLVSLQGSGQPLLLAAALAAIVLVVESFKNIAAWDTARAIEKGLSWKHSSAMVSAAYILTDVAIIFFVLHWLNATGYPIKRAEAVTFGASAFLGLVLVGTYKLVWRAADMAAVVWLAIGVLGSTSLAWTIHNAIYTEHMVRLPTVMRFAFLTTFFVILIRGFIRVALDKNAHRFGLFKTGTEFPYLVIGRRSGEILRIMSDDEVRAILGCTHSDRPRCLGILDEAPSLQGRMIGSMKILSHREFEEIKKNMVEPQNIPVLRLQLSVKSLSQTASINVEESGLKDQRGVGT